MIPISILSQEQALVVKYQQTACSESYGELYKALYRPLFDYVNHIVKSPDDAFDIVQDTFIHASSEVNKLRQPITFRFWLFRIAKNKSIALFKERNKYIKDRYLADGLIQDYDIDESISREAILDKLSTVMQSISIDEQHLLVAKYAEGASIKELMQSTGLGSSAIKMKLMRSRQKMIVAMSCAS
jgi:RNA polymerase sigma-70 factor (ECF subfamily)